MKTISYEGYLTEKKLGSVLKQIFPKIIPQHSFKGETQRFIVDYYLPELNLVVEYNGNRHYSDPKTIYRDSKLKEHLEELDIELLEIPYWMQLDTSTFRFYFGDGLSDSYLKDTEIVNHFPHGFITEKCVLPSSFNFDGVAIFCRELAQILEWSPRVAAQIQFTLRHKIHTGIPQLVLGILVPELLQGFIEIDMGVEGFVGHIYCSDPECLKKN